MANADDIADKLAELQRQFHARLPERLRELRELWSRVSRGIDEQESLAILYRQVHSLTGTAGTYGAQRVCKAAGEVEAALMPVVEAGQPLSSDEISPLMIRLTEVAEAWQPADIPLIPQQPLSGVSDGNRLIDLVDDDPELVEQLRQDLEADGYQVRVHTAAEAFVTQATKQPPAAVVMDMVFAEGNDAGARAIERFKAEVSQVPPIIFISVRSDAEARLAAVRAGADRYLVKPFEASEIRQILDGLTARVAREPYRVLIVDDDRSISSYHAEILRQQGMDVRTIDKPMQALVAMAEFRPELLLLDVYMPVCSGLELAAMVRLDNAYAQMPIVFLSAEADLGRQMAAMNLGGDDFLVKPVTPAHLIDALTARLQRTRWITRLHTDLQIALRDSRYRHIALDQHAPLCIIDQEGRLSYVNDRFCSAVDRRRGELLGQMFELFQVGESDGDVHQEILTCAHQGHVWQGEVSHSRKGGALFWAATTVVPFLNEHGEPYQYVAVMTDVSAQKTIEQDLRKAKGRLDYVLASSPVVLYSLQFEGGELVANWVSNNVDQVFGCSVEEALKVNWWSNNLHPEDRAHAIGRMDGLRDGQSLVQEYRFRHANGSFIWLNDQITIKRADDGSLTDIIGAWTDVTTLRQTQQALVDNEQRLRRSQAYANIGTWDWDIQGDTVYWSERVGPLYGYPEGTLKADYKMFISAVHEEDRARVEDAVKACVDRREDYDIEHRVLWPDGSIRWVLERGDVVRSSDGAPLRMLGVVQDITERKQIEETLAQAKLDAEKANRAKSQFLSSMSHELRTPMNAILGFAQLLELDMDRNLDESQKLGVQEILKAGQHLLALINEVLDLARIEAGRIDLDLESVELESVVNECASLIDPLLESKQINLTCGEGGCRDVVVRADRIRLRQVLLNLMSNAVKYNRLRGGVSVGCALTNDRVRINVTDTGHGIPEQVQNELFKPFSRLVDATSGIEGTGIGLVITKQLVELMGGEIGFDSVAGEGSTFWFELPLVLGEARDKAAAPADDALSARHGSARQSVVYIEDNPANLRLVAQLFAQHSQVELLTAHEPVLGLELARAHRPSLILLDINLPGMSGFEVLKRLRSDEAMRAIPVVAISANAMPQDMARARAAGFDDYVTKPIDIRRLMRLLDKMLGKTIADVP